MTKSSTWAVCPTCEGEGTIVNPAVDSLGLSREDFDEDPDFEEDYRRGVYDIACVECEGRRVVPACRCGKPALAREDGYGDRRERVSSSHFPACFEHISTGDRDDFLDYREMLAMREGERRMGA